MSYTVPNELIADFEELQKQFPGVNWNRWHLMDSASWCGYEEGHSAWLFHDSLVDTLFTLEDIHSVMADYEPMRWELFHPRGLQAVTWEMWFELKEQLESAEMG